MNKSTKTSKSERSSPSQKRSIVLYDSILQAAAFCYEELGFDNSTTGRIAEKAGVGIGSLYRYFPDKDGLLKAIIKKFTDENRAQFVDQLQKLKGKPVGIAIEDMVTHSMAHFMSKQRFFVILISKTLETSNRDLVFEARQKLAVKFAETLIQNFPEVEQSKVNHDLLVKELCQGFHAYMGALFGLIVGGTEKGDAALLHKNMSNLFKSIVIAKNIQ